MYRVRFYAFLYMSIRTIWRKHARDTMKHIKMLENTQSITCAQNMQLQHCSLMLSNEIFLYAFWFNCRYFSLYPFGVLCIISYLYTYLYYCTDLYVQHFGLFISHMFYCVSFCLFKKDIILSGFEKGVKAFQRFSKVDFSDT